MGCAVKRKFLSVIQYRVDVLNVNKLLLFCIFSLIFSFLITTICHGKQILISNSVAKAPIIDGRSDDDAWLNAQPILTTEKLDNSTIQIKCVHHGETLYFLVSFADPDESRRHKEWKWDKNEDMYKMNNLREDTFVFKWNMTTGIEKDLSVYAKNDYIADLWFWKAARTDPKGYADDKIQTLSNKPAPNTIKIKNRLGTTMYLTRKADTGKSSYKSFIPVEFQGDIIPQYQYREPSRSRSDIKAKGVWKNKKWTIEFARKFYTANSDDIQFLNWRENKTPNSHLFGFGVSKYEIAGRKADYKISQPFYGSGDVSEKLFLKINP